MEYISTYRVLRKVVNQVTILPAICGTALLVVSIVFFVNGYELVGVLTMFLGVFSAVFLGQHFLLDSILWAVRHVDDIPQFAKAAELYYLIRAEKFPKIGTILPYKERKKEIENIVFERKERNLLIVKYDNASHLPDFHVYYSFIGSLIFLFLGLFLLFGIFVFGIEGKYASLIEIFIAIMGSAIVFAAFLSLRDSLRGIPNYSIGKDGVMIKKRNLRWDEIEYIGVEEKREGIGKNQHIARYFKVTYKEPNGVLKTEEISIGNTTIAKVDEAIKTFKKPYDKIIYKFKE